MSVVEFRPDPQLAASDPGVSAFVTANAGSGKTTTLVNRVARLLLQDTPPDKILCITYTKAAAAEMQTRLYEVLGEWAVLDDSELRKKLAALGEGRRQPARARRLFALALETPGGLKIQTIHAFCEKLLRRFPLEAGVSPKFQVAEDAVAAEIAAEARDAVALGTLEQPGGALAEAYAHFAVSLDARSFGDMFAGFEARRASIEAYAERLGGAEHIPADVWTRCTGRPEPQDPEAIASAATEPPQFDAGLWRRVIHALNAGGKQDCDCAEALQAVLDLISLGQPAWEAAREALFTDKGQGTPRTLFAKSKALATAGLTEAMGDEIARMEATREAVRAATIARNTVHALALAAAYSEAYGQIKRARSALDFADLVERASALLRTREDAAWVLFKLDGGVEHVLVDEAQDTAPEQWAIVRALTGEFFSGAGVKEREHPRTLFAVGDEKQSIYSFQGARPERLLQEGQAYHQLAYAADHPFEFPQLAKSYRSTPEVLKFVDAVFADQGAANALSPDRPDPPAHTWDRTEHAGSVDLWPTFADEKREDPDWWEPLDAESSESARKRLARAIAEEIARACRERDGVWDKRLKAWRAARPGDFLILVRRRGPLFEEVLRALKKEALPVAGADRLQLSEHAAFNDLLALARFALYPGDDLTVAELLRSPFCDVPEEGESSLYALAQGRKGSMWSNLRQRAGEHPAWAEAVELLQWALRSARREPPYAFFSGALTRRDANGQTMRRRLMARLGAEADEAIEAFLAEVLTLEARVGASLERVVAALEHADVTVKRELDEGAGQVRVMTVHGAKGLEAPVVILPDSTQKQPAGRGGLIATDPGGFLWCGSKKEDCEAASLARAAAQQREDDEYLRLFYVALTRARDRLIVCGRRPGNLKDKEAVDGSWWDLAARAMQRLPTRQVAVGALTATRFGADPTPASTAEPANDDTPPTPHWLTTAPAAEPLSRYRSPSDLAAQRTGAAPSPLSGSGGLGRFRRGSLIHRLLQLLPDLSPQDRAAGAERLLAREPGLSPEQAEEIAGVALAVLADPRFADVFGPGSRAEAAIAGSSPELPEGLAVSGRVDRLLVTPDHVLVIDFKTHRPPPARAEDASPADLVQMATYVAVLRRIFPGRRVEAALVWTDGPSITHLSDDLVASTLATLGRVADSGPDSHIAEPTEE